MPGLTFRPEEIEAINRPTAEAVGLPGRFYGAEALELERDRLFSRRWTPVALASSLPRVGDAVPIDLAGLPLLLVRGGDGEIAAFYNICRHRAMRLVDRPCNVRPTIRCPWHSWSYRLDGQLAATPYLHGYKTAEGDPIDKTGLGLKRIRSAQWFDCIFVDISGQQPTLADHLAPVEALLHTDDYRSLVHGGRWLHRYGGNWKIAVEGAIEDYHLPWGHPQLLDGVRSRRAETSHVDGCFSMTQTRVEYDVDPDNSLPPVRYKNPAAVGSIVNLFPTAVIALQVDHVMVALMLPDGASATSVDFNYYFAPEAMDDRHAAARQQVLDHWSYLAPQDDTFVAGVQANAALRDAAGVQTCFAPEWEGAVHSFQRSVAQALQG